MNGPRLTRRALLGGVAVAALIPSLGWAQVATRGNPRARPLPLASVRLLPSIFLDAVEANRAYLLRLEPDRLLHNFRTSAGLEPRGEVYGGWESDTIAGHTLGHYLSALSLMHAQTGVEECRRRVGHIVAELAACQAAHGDGYVAGFTRRRQDGAIEDGKALFAELMRGDIRALPFDLNGCWVPLYNWHKTFAGLFDAQTHAGNDQALAVAHRLGTYIDGVFAALDDEQVQRVLDCEHGGINESFAELHVRTGEARWLRLAERLRHRRILDPLAERRDVLPWIHANTQIPKLIGLARLHEITGHAADAAAARFFWETVTRDYSYVIGGNADREYFPAPRTVSRHITEQTCESCNSYNMLKLTRHLYAWQPEARLFDYFERTHFNHILAQQDPATGMFAYMVPLMSGSHRSFSTPEDSFWCCVGSGMESHSKHGESVWWESGDSLIANLYVPSVARWAARGARVRMETAYPYGDRVELLLEAVGDAAPFEIALRVPGWCEGAGVAVNGEVQAIRPDRGYFHLRRAWRVGDRISLDLPMTLRAEPTIDDSDTLAWLHGPLVLAADLGAVDQPWDGPAPALVAADPAAGFTAIDAARGRFRTAGIGRPGDLDFAPFLEQRHRRTAVYFRSFDEAGWAAEQVARAAAAAELRALDARSVDIVRLGDEESEAGHGLESAVSYPVVYRGREGRDARAHGHFQFRARVSEVPLVLRATYWGEERDKMFDIIVGGRTIATQRLHGERPGEFFDVEYPIPPELAAGREEVLVRFQPSSETSRCGPVYGVRILAARTA